MARSLLDEGVAAFPRLRGQAARLGEWLRARHADVPATPEGTR